MGMEVTNSDGEIAGHIVRVISTPYSGTDLLISLKLSSVEEKLFIDGNRVLIKDQLS
jgi:hypothetical protein